MICECRLIQAVSFLHVLPEQGENEHVTCFTVWFWFRFFYSLRFA